MTLPNVRYIRLDRNTGQWFGALCKHGPWHPIPAPQSVPPFPTMSTTPKPSGLTPADHMALAACRLAPYGERCKSSCNDCRRQSAAVAHEIARQLRERHGGSSTTADWLDGVGCHG